MKPVEQLKTIEMIIWIAFVSMVVLIYIAALFGCDEANINTLREEIHFKKHPETVRLLWDGEHFSAVSMTPSEVPSDAKFIRYRPQVDLQTAMSMNGQPWNDYPLIFLIVGNEGYDTIQAKIPLYLIREDFKP